MYLITTWQPNIEALKHDKCTVFGKARSRILRITSTESTETIAIEKQLNASHWLEYLSEDYFLECCTMYKAEYLVRFRPTVEIDF